jgi:hypothetical protein
MSTKTPQTGDWVKALRPGTINATTGQKFIKAGELFQLTEDIPFSDTWMEAHEKPADVAPKKEDVKAEQDKAVRDHEETDRIRRGKFSLPRVPRSEESQAERAEKAKADLRKQRADDLAKRSTTPVAPPARTVAPAIDRGSKGPQAHETSANPSRVDENAVRTDKGV